MIRALPLCLALVLLVGCRSQEEPVRGAQLEPAPIAEPAPPPPAVKRIIDTPVPASTFEEPAPVEEEEPEKPTRDLAGELKAAVGIPADCVRDFEASTPTTIRIYINAIVRPTGMIIEPTASGLGLSDNARNCVEQRVGAVTLQPLGEPVSQTVSTYVEVNYTPPVVIEADPSVPEPQLRNVKEPLPKRPDIPPSGRPITEPTSKPIQEPTSKDPTGPPGKPIKGPKPRPIDGYEVDESAQQWSDK